jgi:hypothetical protein
MPVVRDLVLHRMSQVSIVQTIDAVVTQLLLVYLALCLRGHEG